MNNYSIPNKFFTGNKNINSSIFNKNIKKSKIRPFNKHINDVGKIKYIPASSKEWKNSVYSFNNNNIVNYPIYNININDLIKNYFNLFFNHRFIKNKFKSTLSKRKSLNKIYISKSEIKHTNSKAIITLYIFNKEKFSLLKKIRNLKKIFYNKIFFLVYKSRESFNKFLFKLFSNQIVKPMELYKYYNIFTKYSDKFIESLLIKELILIRRYKLKLSLNKYKFEEKFLYRLAKLISKLYNKKIEFNIINQKSIMLNSDLFTEIFSLKVKKREANLRRIMNIFLNKASLPKVNRIEEKSRINKSVDFNLVENKYKNLDIFSILKNKNLDEILNDTYYNPNNSNELYDIIFNSIKYKNIGGIRLQAKGRLTRRFRADRSLFKVKWKGGLKNIDSSYKGLSTVNMRGYINSNVEYSMLASKRRIGAFAVKGWISGK